MNHYQNFKNLILDHPHQALHSFAAEEAVGVDPAARILAVRQEQLQERFADEVHAMSTSTERFTGRGLKRGLRQAVAAVLICELERKFGFLTEAQHRRIEPRTLRHC